MKPPFTSQQEMYNYAASQLINQTLSQETVKKNLMEHGITDADAETVVKNMMVVIEEQKKEKGIKQTGTNNPEHAFSSSQQVANPKNSYGSFTTTQEMYNY